MLETTDRRERFTRQLFVIAALACLSVLVLIAGLSPDSTARNGELETAPPEENVESTPPKVDAQPGTISGSRRAQSRDDAILDAPDLIDPARPGPDEYPHYERLLHQARRDPAGFRRVLDELLTGEHAVAETIAGLRASYNARVDAKHTAFQACLTKDAQPELRAFAVRFLASVAPEDRKARDALAGYLRTLPPDVGQRAAALFAILRSGNQIELRRCWLTLYIERDPRFVARAAVELSKNPLGEKMLKELVSVHPLEEARARMRDLQRRGWQVPASGNR